MDIDLFGDSPKQYHGGYAGDPGRGPAGETCGTCRHCFAPGGTAATYYKCGMSTVTHGAATDIRVKTPACQYWEGE